MAKYRKCQIVIEARRFETNNDDGTCIRDLVDWVNMFGNPDASASHDETDIYVKTPEGIMKARCGDWIIKGVNGEFYPCKPDIFEKTYEAVQD